MRLAPGTSLGRYEVVEAISGSDVRFKAIDRSSNRVVLVTLGPTAYQEAVLARLQREAEALSALAHAHICPPIEIGHEHLTNQELRPPHRMHHAGDERAIGRIDFRPDVGVLEPRVHHHRSIERGHSQHHRVATCLQRATHRDVRKQVAERAPAVENDPRRHSAGERLYIHIVGGGMTSARAVVRSLAPIG